MSYSKYPQAPIVYRDWVDTLLKEASDKLTSWESTFVDSIDKQLLRHITLTQSQAEKLEDIYAQYTE